ncbi:hypothetical protein ATANTOWER_007548 [Ataeniobius toweri]|uniref:Dynein light chain n=1 Tax=Ataeniobius toweri TaxID=208326 RepID=A0ABU7BME7_9TELE|nr:hypothetical protein [Ataeniobius toweri]
MMVIKDNDHLSSSIMVGDPNASQSLILVSDADAQHCIFLRSWQFKTWAFKGIAFNEQCSHLNYSPLDTRQLKSNAMSDRKPVIKNADMTEDMQQDAVECATQALEKYNIEKDIAAYIKKEFDKKYNPTWHCIVGRNFGSYVTHETKHFIYFYLGQVAILLFKSG